MQSYIYYQYIVIDIAVLSILADLRITSSVVHNRYRELLAVLSVDTP